MRQNVTKRLKARQKCVDDENAISKKLPLQHKLGVAFSYLERNKLESIIIVSILNILFQFEPTIYLRTTTYE